MARLQEWLDLTGSTIRSVGSRDVAGLYEREWPAVRQKLLEDHRSSIEREPKRWKRWIRTASAMMYGLTRRLTPERRLLFLISLVVGLLSFVYLGVLIGSWNNALKTLVSLLVAFAVLVFLLALELIDKLHFRDELELARDLQASLLPKEMPRVPGLEVSAFNRIANTVGGDLYDFATLPDGRVAILFGDASGHGMAAGLVMAVAQAGFRTQLEVSAAPEAVVTTLNRLLCRTGGSRSFFSACYVVLSGGGAFEGVVAGHPPILQIRDGGTIVRKIGRGSYPLGIKAPYRWDSFEGRLEPGESLVFSSDGIPESRDRHGEAFGYDALERVASRHAGAPDFCERVLAEWAGAIDGGTVDDDVSLALVRRLGPEGPAAGRGMN
ncbi:MAG TPA: PP2C family protein-serine/threonine phosphatase [Thermoanaerobaculia bacterium]|nr:PP2C family protein-serine/threonine phosphatase [Thermoanaerobaculia bacterium]